MKTLYQYKIEYTSPLKQVAQIYIVAHSIQECERKLEERYGVAYFGHCRLLGVTEVKTLK